METTSEGSPLGCVLDGRYRIVEALGEGGMGAVYLAEHLKLGRKVALKLLHAEYGEDPTLRARFEREAHALGALSHPSIVAVTDYGIADDTPYLVMELLRGRTLRDVIEEGPLEPAEAFRIARETLRGLAYAHGEGVAHRDLKPANVFLQATPDGLPQVKLLDFGLAKFVAADSPPGGPLTRAGSVIGTPSYMAPEQAAGDATDARTDVYALGIVLFEMLTGQRPFEGPSGEVLRQQILMPFPTVEERCPTRAASPELRTFLERATAKAKAARFQSARDALDALDALPQPAIRSVDPTTTGDGSLPAPRPLPPAVHLSTSASTPSARPPTPKWVVHVALAFGALLLVGSTVLGVVVLVVLRKTDAPVSHSPAIAASAPPSVAASIDPWSGANPSLLAAIKAQTERGADVSSRVEGQLRTYARAHRGDPRPYLLLGRIYLRRGWRPDATEHYEKAYDESPTAAGDPVMLADLVALCAHGNTSRRAAALLRRAYGTRAIPAIDAALARSGLDRDDRARLQTLRGSLGP